MTAPTPSPQDWPPARAPGTSGSTRHFLLIKTARSTARTILPDEIVALLSRGNYCVIRLTRQRSMRVRGTLTAWRARLPEAEFMRVHRTAVVNLRAVTQIVSHSREVLLLFLRGMTTPVRARRALHRELEARLTGSPAKRTHARAVPGA